MTTQELVKLCSTHLSEECLLRDIQFAEAPTDLENYYVDTGRSDVMTRVFKVPTMHEDKTLVGYTMIDKYRYGREQNTSKKYELTLLYERKS
jgi:hypothetical protein